MKYRTIALPLLISALVISAPTHAEPNIATDPVTASFQRMLGHQPPAADYRYVTESGNDPLLTHLAAALHQKKTNGTPATQHP